MDKFVEFTDAAGVRRIVNVRYIVQLTIRMSETGRVFMVCLRDAEPTVKGSYNHIISEDVFNLIKAQLWTKEK